MKRYIAIRIGFEGPEVLETIKADTIHKACEQYGFTATVEWMDPDGMTWAAERPMTRADREFPLLIAEAPSGRSLTALLDYCETMTCRLSAPPMPLELWGYMEEEEEEED